MNFISYARLAKDVEAIVPALPEDIGLVVGIPRSGMIVALMIAQQLKCPATSLDWPLDYSIDYSKRLKGQKTGERILLVDDSSRTGNTMKRALSSLTEKTKGRPVSTLVMYVTGLLSLGVDRFARIIPAPRVFQWNALNHSILRTSLVDIDGVLCRDPKKAEYSSPDKMAAFVTSVKPKTKAEYRVMAYVTWRPDTLKGRTVKWLKAHGFRYGKIYFRPSALRDRVGVSVQTKAYWKANIYKKHRDARLFVESDSKIAKIIHQRTKRPVLATDRWVLFK